VADAPDWLARSQEAGHLLSQGRADDAVLIFKEVARANPKVADAHNNLGVALKATGRLKEAVDGYRRALKLQPGFDVARLNMARVLRQLGRNEENLRALAIALRNTPESEEVHFEIGVSLLDMRFGQPSPAAREILLSYFQNGVKDLQPFAEPATRLLLSNRRFEQLVMAAARVYPDGDPGRFMAPRELADPLLIAVLTWTIVPFPEIEAWITLARRQLLELARRGERITSDPGLLWAIAAQCQATELAQRVVPAERNAAAELAGGLGDGDGEKIAITAMFLPLESIPAALELSAKTDADPGDRSPRNALLTRAIVDRRAEREIAVGIQSLTSIEDATSTAVREQYEANPYPRWLSVEQEKSPLSLASRVAKRFPGLATDSLDLVSPQVLVAGCGTGRHAIGTAARHAGSRVLAIDLSRTSLAFAKRQAEKLGQGNVSFAQGDILELGTLRDRFDLIESSGVLHHMANPLAGWGALRALMKPRGLMRIGLYSELARSNWLVSRTNIPDDLDVDQTNELIREKRVEMIKNASEGPELAALGILDFYSLSGARDLLFHASETRFSLPEIADALSKLGLEFLGFENLVPSVSENFSKRFPMPRANQDLKCWDAYERDNPDTFIGMYQFWCQAKT
jgi:SAM-dependent methyltransferase/tetratricopeptide (TPR) repeat protein